MKLSKIVLLFLIFTIFQSNIYSRPITIVHMWWTTHRSFHHENVNTFEELLIKRNAIKDEGNTRGIASDNYWECIECKQLIKDPDRLVCNHAKAKFVIFVVADSGKSYEPLWCLVSARDRRTCLF